MDKSDVEKMLMELATNKGISEGAAITLMQKLLQIDVTNKAEVKGGCEYD